MIEIKYITPYRRSDLITEGYMYQLKPDCCYNNQKGDLYIKDTEGNYYKLPDNCTITQRDIKIFICGIKQVLNVEFERVIKKWE